MLALKQKVLYYTQLLSVRTIRYKFQGDSVERNIMSQKLETRQQVVKLVSVRAKNKSACDKNPSLGCIINTPSLDTAQTSEMQ